MYLVSLGRMADKSDSQKCFRVKITASTKGMFELIPTKRIFMHKISAFVNKPFQIYTSPLR